MFQIEVENSSIFDRLAAAPDVLNREMTSWLVDMAQWIKRDLQMRVPVKTGTLKSSIRYELSRSESGGEATFYSVFYGKYIDEGTKPFTILAKNGKPMVFERGDEKVFTMRVANPGIKPRDFTLQTLDAAADEADRQAEEVGDRIFRSVIG
jgi:hypothetical protein